MIEGFIFDMDGVLIDTIEYHYLAWKQLADDEDIPFTRADNDRIRGLSRYRAIQQLFDTTDETRIQTLMARKGQYFNQYVERITPDDLLPGVRPLINAARSAGIKVGMASSSRFARPICERLGVVDQFAAFADGTSVPNTKPAPDPFVWVAGGLRLNPNRCVVFEDAASGVEAALAGGFYVVGVGDPELVQGAHLIVNRLTEVSVERLQAVFGEQTPVP